MKKYLSKAFAAVSAFVVSLFAGFHRAYASVDIGGCKELPCTGDNSNSKLALWILLGAGAVIVVCAVFMFAKKKK